MDDPTAFLPASAPCSGRVTLRAVPPATALKTARRRSSIPPADVRSSSAPEVIRQRPGPLSRLLAWADGLPLGGWWLYALFAVGLLGWGQGIEWLLGRTPVGTIDLNLLVLLPYGPYSLVALALGVRIATGALETFWPATGWPDSARSGWTHRFTYAPFWPESLALLLGAFGGVAAMLGAPASMFGPDVGREETYVAYLPLFVAGYALSAAAFVITLRWLRLVARIQREAQAVDVFDRAPVNAFSRLTVVVGLSYLLATYYSLTVNGAFQAGNVASLVFLGGTMLFAVLAFTVPMWGIHDRLAREKETLLRDVERRTNRLAAELYARIDEGRFDSTSVINSSLSGLTAMRERIEHLPTWPWRPNLFRGFVSALLLPLIVFVLTRMISGLI
jgi:hypothetical protein